MADVFDLFCFEHCDSMLDILSSTSPSAPGEAEISTVDAGGQVVPDYPDPPATSCDLGVLSGESGNGAFPDDNALVQSEPFGGVPNQWTTEWIVTFESLPADFGDLVNHHIYLGSSDAAGPCLGLFFSEDGVAYTGSVHLDGADLEVDAAVTVIPGSASSVVTGEPIVVRIAADGDSGVAYIYVTTKAQADLTGQVLVAVVSVFQADDMAFPPIDRSLISVRGTEAEPSRAAFDKWCMAASVLVPNLPPVADAGLDQALRTCSVVLLDGSASVDPEGAPLQYSWRLIHTPLTSEFSVNGNDGRTFPLLSPTGFTDKFHSVSLGLVHASDALDAGDVLLVDAVAYDIVTTGSDVNGFFIQVTDATIPDAFTAKAFRVFRQRGVSGANTVRASFLPDVLGFYRFDLIVSDGLLSSQPSVTVVNVVESALPRGIVPDAKFVFDYLSDYWRLLEDSEPIATLWSGMMQVASSELYTLWQHDYAKSLRDIQRTFVRRWLHYDLLLAEPLPELTALRVFYGGVDGINMLAAGQNANGMVFTISSAFHATKTITIVSANPVTATQLANEVRNRLLELDTRYVVSAHTRLSTNQFVRVNAPFPFTISGASPAQYIGNGSNSLVSGTGTAVSTRTYQVDTTLANLGIRENDLLILGTEAFRIAQVVDDPADDYRFQRVVLKTDIPVNITTWTISGFVRSELLDFYNGLVSQADPVYFVVSGPGVDGDALVSTTALGVASDEVSNLAIALPTALGNVIADGRFTVRLAKIVRRTHLPIDELVVDVPTLTELIDIQDDTATLRRNVDFFIETVRGHNALRFDPAVWEGEDPPDRLWAEYTYLDNSSTIEDNFGLLAGITVDQMSALPGSVDYLSAVRGLWYAYVNGPTMHSLRVGAQILLGLPFAEEPGTIEEVRTDFSPTFGRILIRDRERTEIVRSYTFPRSLDLEVNPATGVPYAIGDSVEQFAPLVKGVEVVDYVSDPTWFVGLINQGIFYEVEKFFRFLVRIDSAVFGLDALSFVNDFMLAIKPTYTYPLFIITQEVTDSDISVTDTVTQTLVLTLLDVICDLTPFSTALDDARATGGGYWNQLDTDSNDATPPPTHPTSDTVEFGLDRYVLCPEDSVSSHTTQVFPGSALASTGLNFVPADDLFNVARFLEAGPFTVANGATGESITADVGDTVPDAGTIEELRVLISGGPGAEPTGYEVVIAINGSDEIIQAFTSTPIFTDVSFVVSEAVVAADVITARIRHAGGAPRSPAWTHVRIEVGVNLGAWVGGDTLGAGNYGFRRTLV